MGLHSHFLNEQQRNAGPLARDVTLEKEWVYMTQNV